MTPTETLAKIKLALVDCIAVMNEAGRTAAEKELTNDELGRMWLSVVANAEHALSHLTALEQMGEQQWQPIETAPRDGTEILAVESGSISCVRYIQNVGWRDYSDIGAAGIDPLEPTHWMPLPCAPKPEGE